MNKERELLEKFCRSSWTYNDWLLLKAEAEELLAKPEPEQEPDVWRITQTIYNRLPLVTYVYSKPREQVYKYYRVEELYLKKTTGE